MGIKPFFNAFAVSPHAFASNSSDGIIKSQGLHGIELITAVLRTCKMSSILFARARGREKSGPSWESLCLVAFHCRRFELIRLHGLLGWIILYHLGCVPLVKPLQIHASMTRRATVTGAANSGTCTLCQAGAYSSVSGVHRSRATCSDCGWR